MITEEEMDAALEEMMNRGPRADPNATSKETQKALDQYLNIELNKAMMWYIKDIDGTLVERIYSAGHFATGLALGLILAKHEVLSGSSDPDDIAHTYERDPE